MDQFDLRNTILPFSLLILTNHFKQMRTGQAVEITADDPTFTADLKRLLPPGAFQMDVLPTSDKTGPRFRLMLKKLKSASATAFTMRTADRKSPVS